MRNLISHYVFSLKVIQNDSMGFLVVFLCEAVEYQYHQKHLNSFYKATFR